MSLLQEFNTVKLLLEQKSNSLAFERAMKATRNINYANTDDKKLMMSIQQLVYPIAKDEIDKLEAVGRGYIEIIFLLNQNELAHYLISYCVNLLIADAESPVTLDNIIELLTESFASTHSEESAFYLGLLHSTPSLIPGGVEDAIEYYEYAAAKGLVEAQRNLA